MGIKPKIVLMFRDSSNMHDTLVATSSSISIFNKLMLKSVSSRIIVCIFENDMG